MDPKREPPAEERADDGNPLADYTRHGTYMTPEQAMALHAADRAVQARAPHREQHRDRRPAEVVWPVWMLHAATLFIAITTFFFRHRAFPKHG